MTSRTSWAGRRVAGLTLALPLLLLTAGCSSNGSVSGTVTFDGKPMPGGTVTFVGEGGGGGSAQINAKDGTYEITKLPKGKMKVSVKPYEPPQMGGRGGPPGMGRGMPPGMRTGEGGAPKGANLPEGVDPSIFNPAAKAEGSKAVRIPDRFLDPEKSGLTTTIAGGKNVYDIPIPKE